MYSFRLRLLTVITVLFAATAMVNTANASPQNRWLTDDMLLSETIEPLEDFMDPDDPSCEQATVNIATVKLDKTCIRTHGNLRYIWGTGYIGSPELGIDRSINLSNGYTFYPVINAPNDLVFDSFYDENKAFFRTAGNSQHFIMDKFKSRLLLTTSPESSPQYREAKYLRLLNNETESVFHLIDGGWYDINNVTYSQNNEWRYFVIDRSMIVRMNMNTYESQVVYRYTYGEEPTLSNGLNVKINYEGDIVYVADNSGPKFMLHVTDDCVRTLGRKASVTRGELFEKYPTCHKRLFSDKEFNENRSKYALYEISPDGQELIFTTRNQYPEPYKWVKIHPSGHTPSKIDYLALGDSYSSGEGDMGKKEDGSSYYLPWTDTESDYCHISEQSYPFQIAKARNLNIKHVKSLACSGARVLKDYYGDSNNYSGQNERLRDMNSEKLIYARSEAIRIDVPGRIKQIDFVKKYRPKVITLTAGGNDIGFSDILTYCASGYTKAQISYTCAYAQPGELRKTLAASIAAQFTYNKMMIKSLQSASPSTKIYIIGYPSFVKANSIKCINSGIMNSAERLMINEAVSYMNNILRSVARATGSIYIDIEDSLVGGRLCEGSEYMTGPINVKFDPSNSNMMHPNAKGHMRIKDSIIKSGHFNLSPKPTGLISDESVTPPPVPPYFTEFTVDDGLAYGRMILDDVNLDKIAIIGGVAKKGIIAADNVLRAGTTVASKFSPSTFQPNTLITLKAYSEEVTLGNFPSNMDGSFNTDIFLDLDPGLHTIVVSGISPEGEKTTFYQFVTVIGADLDDIDDDGVPNDIDKCNFIEDWIDEGTGKDICDQESVGLINSPQPVPLKNGGDVDINTALSPGNTPAYHKLGVDENMQLDKRDILIYSDRGPSERSRIRPADGSGNILNDSLSYYTAVSLTVVAVIIGGSMYVKKR